MPGFGPPYNPAAIQPPYVSGRWYPATPVTITAAGTAQASGTVRLQAIAIRRPVTISDLWTKIGTASGGGNIQLALYASDPTTQLPTGSVLVSTASISTTSTGSVSSAAAATLAPGLYWFATNADNSTVALSSSGTAAWILGAPLFGSTTLANVSGSLVLTTPMPFNTWSSMTSATFTEAPATTESLWGFKAA